ncbi:MAG TPA: NADH-quinone oxidoreductase subunit L, partial [Rhodothermales bacterium]|nr:NADH-quinone oxidoreductase subunit L [Rhodothermales bacterium]
MQQIIPLIPVLPLLGFLINGLVGKKMGKSIVGALGTGTIASSFLFTVWLFIALLGDPEPIECVLFTWLNVGNLHVEIGFLVDRLSVWMMLVITGVGTLIHIYSIGYMHEDEGFHKFFAYLNLFVFSMLLLVMGNNFLLLFFGWEGVGLCSYLLIGFWYTKRDYADAARKAFIMNRVGDLGLLLGIFMISQHYGSIAYADVFSKAGLADAATIGLITLLLFVGAMGKSAQIPLYTWLPDAMAGPTPVSALIHAATMVTAGIYLVVRASALYDLAPETLSVIAWVGLATSLFAALIGLGQNDIKKVLAYSTVSQLGLMFVAAGVGAYGSAMFHLTTHAFFKALLFLGAGSVIHAMNGGQDLRHMGGLRKSLRTTHWTFLFGTFAIIGIFPFAGFFSKDELLAKIFEHNPLMWALTLFSAALTVVYMIRMYTLTFWGEFRGTKEQAVHLHESPLVMTLPLMILAVLSLISGLLNLPAFTHLQWFSGYLAPLLGEAAHIMTVSTELVLMGIAFTVAVGLGFWAWKHYQNPKQVPVEEEALKGFAKLVGYKF